MRKCELSLLNNWIILQGNQIDNKNLVNLIYLELNEVIEIVLWRE